MSTPLETMEGMRVRMQRIADSRFSSGWILSVEQSTVSIKPNIGFVADSKDEFFCQAYGPNATALFHARCLSLSKPAHLFDLVGQARFGPPAEQARILVSGMSCEVDLGWFEGTCEIIDISLNGVGMYSPMPIETGTKMSLQLHTPLGILGGTGEVRYCRSLSGASASHRVGLLLDPFDRINDAKWRMVLREALTGSASA